MQNYMEVVVYKKKLLFPVEFSNVQKLSCNFGIESIFTLLKMKFDKSTIGLNLHFIFSMLTKFFKN